MADYYQMVNTTSDVLLEVGTEDDGELYVQRIRYQNHAPKACSPKDILSLSNARDLCSALSELLAEQDEC